MKKIIKFFVSILVSLKILTPIRTAKLKFLYTCHKWPNFEHPKDINEKINWMKFYGDTTKWYALADKYAVREKIKSFGLERILIPLLGKWDSAESIEWDKLPNQFIMKGNAGSGDVIICRDKKTFDTVASTVYFKKILGKTYGILTGEPHYKNVKPCIIIEELFDASTQPCNSSSLIDYKVWCFDGVPKYVWCCYNRHKYHAEVGLYDMDWQYHPEWSVFTEHYIESSVRVPRPDCFNDMMDIAAKLSKGFPVVRIDLYEIKGKVYFGEYTFTSSGGFMNFYTQDFLNKMGELTILPADK
jgi:hypothetical protein